MKDSPETLRAAETLRDKIRLEVTALQPDFAKLHALIRRLERVVCGEGGLSAPNGTDERRLVAAATDSVIGGGGFLPARALPPIKRAPDPVDEHGERIMSGIAGIVEKFDFDKLLKGSGYDPLEATVSAVRLLREITPSSTHMDEVCRRIYTEVLRRLDAFDAAAGAAPEKP